MNPKEKSKSGTKPLYLNDDEFIKNPFAIVKKLGNFSVSQTNIIMTLIANIQDRLDEISSQPKNTQQLSIWADEEFVNDKIQFTLPLKSLGIKARDYQDLEDACQRLTSVTVPVTRFKEDGKSYHANIPMIRCWIPDVAEKANGEALKFKNGTRRTGELIIEIEKIISTTYFHTRNGYTNQLYKLNRKCKRSKTFPIYSILSRYKEKWGDNDAGIYIEDYQKVKQLLGVLSFKPGTQLVDYDTYPKWKDFKRRVIDPSQVELKGLFEEERSDFYFEYTPIYEDGRAQRGNPDKIRFELIFSKNAEATEMKDESPKVDTESHGGLQAYVNALRAAWNGDEEKRKEYPNWERDYPKYQHLYV